MKIHEVIRKYRREAKLTQEQVANYLGVSAPAVNKWEKGVSYPDITILVPLARLLNTDVDTLLSFREELSQDKINELILEVYDLAREKAFSEAFQRGEELIKEYPSCDALMLYIAQILDMQLTSLEEEGEIQAYKKKINCWYAMIASGKEEHLANQAKVALINYHTMQGAYEKAQQLLDETADEDPKIGYEKRIVQANLYAKQGRSGEACEIYETMLQQYALKANSTLMLLLERMIQEKKLEQAELLGEKIQGLAELLELGDYIKYTPEFYLGLESGDKERSLDALERMAESLDSLLQKPDTGLYSHMKAAGQTERGRQLTKEIVKKSLEKDQEMDFLRKEKRFQKIMESLEKIPEKIE